MLRAKMPSKDLMDRIRQAYSLTSLIDRLNEPAAEELAEHLSPHLRRGEGLPDLELVQQLLGRLVLTRLEELIAAEEEFLGFDRELSERFQLANSDLDFDLDFD